MIKHSFGVRALIGFSQGKGRLSNMLCTLRTREDLRKMILQEESFDSFPVGAGSAREEKEEKIYAPPSEDILQVFLLILTGLSVRDCCLFL